MPDEIRVSSKSSSSSWQHEPLSHGGGCQELPSDYRAYLEISYFNKSQVLLVWQDVVKASETL